MHVDFGCLTSFAPSVNLLRILTAVRTYIPDVVLIYAYSTASMLRRNLFPTKSTAMWVIVLFLTALISVCGASVKVDEAREVQALRTFTELLRNKVGKNATAAVEALSIATFSQV